MTSVFSKTILPLFKKKVVKNAFALYAGRSINLAIGLFSTLFYGVIFLKKDIAVISLFEMVVNLFLSFGFSWSTMALTRFGKEELKKNDSINFTSSIRIGIIAPILIASIMVMIFFSGNILDYMGTNDITIIIYLIINLILLVIHEHIIYIFTTVEKHTLNVMYYVGQSLGKVCILGTFYFGMVNNINAELYIKMNVGVLLILLIMRIPFMESKYVLPIIAGKKDDYIKQFKYVLPQIYGFCGLYMINWVDVYFIRKYCNFDDLGAYQFMYSIFLKLSSFAIIINTIFFPKIMDWKISGSINFNKYLKNAPIIMFLTILISITIFLHSYKPLFFIFFKDKFQNAYMAFNILVLSLPFIFGSYLYVPVLNSYDRVKYIQMVNVISASCNILIDYVFIKRYGMIAAAFGTLLAYLCKYLLLSIEVEKMFNVKYRLVNAIGVIMAVCGVIYFT
jgi:O-antigen/teichoic acid export membrane protein